MSQELNYTEAYQELQEIVADMEHSKISIDELDHRIKRASVLLKICKDKLLSTEKNVQEVLDEIKNYSVNSEL